MRGFHNRAAALIMVLALAHAQAEEKPRIVSTRIALETQASAVTLPAGPASTLVLSACSGCAPQSFLATQSTIYLLGDQPVSLAEMKAALAGRPQTLMTVTYSAKTRELTRVTASTSPATTGSR
jgi:hypothetical protein